LRLAALAATPALLEALRDFALGQRGPDALRIEAANTACAADLIPTGPVRLWQGGEWREILMLGWEIHEEPTGSHPPAVEQLAREAIVASQEGDGALAERLLRQALEKAPDAPDLLNNLATAYEIQGRKEESAALIRQIHERFPDYFFGRANLAHLYVREGRLEEAAELLKPLLLHKRLHRTELAALAAAEIALRLAEGNRDAARSWLDIWKSADPDHPSLAMWRERVEERGRLSRFFGRRR
ncbi:MAG TPA: tetratricopeptide repeat protein, partial [Gemmataceae bacterium]|nr:tetratricopeptide repeat protein [Gemmataceae bacterium]